MSNFKRVTEVCHQLWIDVMQRAEVNVEVCHVEEQESDKSNERRQGKGKGLKKSKIKRKKPKPVESDWETDSEIAVLSGWEGEDELNASQYLPGDDSGPSLVRKRPAESSLDSELGDQPLMKRHRTGVHEAD